jgi:hypothetical protein
MTSQNIDLSSWDVLYRCSQFAVFCNRSPQTTSLFWNISLNCIPQELAKKNIYAEESVKEYMQEFCYSPIFCCGSFSLYHSNFRTGVWYEFLDALYRHCKSDYSFSFTANVLTRNLHGWWITKRLSKRACYWRCREMWGGTACEDMVPSVMNLGTEPGSLIYDLREEQGKIDI